MNISIGTAWLITLACFIIGLWPIGIIGIPISIYLTAKNLIEYRVDYEQDRKTAKDSEAEIYKTAAEIEHQLNEDKP